MPSSINVRGGNSTPITVYALRKDGFAGEIALALKDAPAGFTLSGGRVPANQDQVRLTLDGPVDAPDEPVTLHLEGRATIDGRRSSPGRARRRHDAGLRLPASRAGPGAEGERCRPLECRDLPREILSDLPVKIPAGGSGRVQFSVPLTSVYGKVHLELDEPPDGIELGEVTAAGSGTEIVLKSDAAKAKPGLQGNLIVQAFIARDQSTKKGKNSTKHQLPVGTLPAIPFEIVGSVNFGVRRFIAAFLVNALPSPRKAAMNQPFSGSY